jgi:REP element-mobilizing transposase RayT
MARRVIRSGKRGGGTKGRSCKDAQLDLPFRRWGGRRAGAGRKPTGGRASASHLRRAAVSWRTPVHVTMRVRPEVWRLRSRRCFRQIHAAFIAARERFECRVVHYSVQGNHLHLVAEARDARELARGMQGIAIRIARALGRLMGRSGKIFSDRYSSRPLATPLEVRRALSYVLNNARRHAAQRGRTLPRRWLDPFSTADIFDGWGNVVGAGRCRECRSEPRSWLLRVGWRRHGLLDADAVPGSL